MQTKRIYLPIIYTHITIIFRVFDVSNSPALVSNSLGSSQYATHYFHCFLSTIKSALTPFFLMTSSTHFNHHFFNLRLPFYPSKVLLIICPYQHIPLSIQLFNHWCHFQTISNIRIFIVLIFVIHHIHLNIIVSSACDALYMQLFI